MGTFFENNDTLQITSEQGFPEELNYEQHCQAPLTREQFQDRVFQFHGKSGLRNFHTPPVRVFLVHNIDGKWLYWGTIEMLEIVHDYQTKMTSGTYRIKEIFTPEQMKQAYDLIDADKGKGYIE